jgi:hypothetical protein
MEQVLIGDSARFTWQTRSITVLPLCDTEDRVAELAIWKNLRGIL